MAIKIQYFFYDIKHFTGQIEKSNENIPPHCNCRDKSSCPVPGRCATTNVVYQATVTREDQGTSTTYTGLASNIGNLLLCWMLVLFLGQN